MSKWIARLDRAFGVEGYYVDEEGKDVCSLYRVNENESIIPYENAKKNAKLIAAAPDMLLTLKALVFRYKDRTPMGDIIKDAERLQVRLKC